MVLVVAKGDAEAIMEELRAAGETAYGTGVLKGRVGERKAAFSLIRRCGTRRLFGYASILSTVEVTDYCQSPTIIMRSQFHTNDLHLRPDGKRSRPSWLKAWPALLGCRSGARVQLRKRQVSLLGQEPWIVPVILQAYQQSFLP